MLDKDSHFFFMGSLKSSAKIELKRREVQDLATTIATVESFIDFSILRDTTKFKKKKRYQGKGMREHSKPNKKGNKDNGA